MFRFYLAAAAGMALLLLLAISAVQSGPLIVYNASASAPPGFYMMHTAKRLRRSDLVLARLPRTVADLAAQRGYLPFGVPLVKRIAALPDDLVCSLGRTISIDGQAQARQLVSDREGRALPQWQGCLRLETGDVFLLMADVQDSFDGRYFGPIRRDAVIGKLTPLWTW